MGYISQLDRRLDDEIGRKCCKNWSREVILSFLTFTNLCSRFTESFWLDPVSAYMLVQSLWRECCIYFRVTVIYLIIEAYLFTFGLGGRWGIQLCPPQYRACVLQQHMRVLVWNLLWKSTVLSARQASKGAKASKSWFHQWTSTVHENCIKCEHSNMNSNNNDLPDPTLDVSLQSNAFKFGVFKRWREVKRSKGLKYKTKVAALSCVMS